MTYWRCDACGHSRNIEEDGPACENCLVDATAPVADRAPGEVETAAVALRERYGRLGILSRAVVHNQPTAEDIVQVVLDAVPGRFRDDTVTLAEALAFIRGIAELELVSAADRAVNAVGQDAREFLARFGAGRAEDKPPPAKDPTQ